MRIKKNLYQSAEKKPVFFYYIGNPSDGENLSGKKIMKLTEKWPR